MNKVFIDCGSNTGNGLRQFISMFNIDTEWKVECFEANPDLELDEDLKQLPNVITHNAAVWDRTGKVQFSIFDANHEGSNVECLLDAGYCADKNYMPHDHVIEVDCIDICDILDKYSEDDFIVVKLDVEGSEFSILRRLLNSNKISKINELYVEWHTTIMSSESLDSERVLKEEIAKHNVNFHNWF